MKFSQKCLCFSDYWDKSPIEAFLTNNWSKNLFRSGEIIGYVLWKSGKSLKHCDQENCDSFSNIQI